MEYNEVLEHFKKDIQNNPDIEIIKLKHGVMIFYWDEAEHSYLSINSQLCTDCRRNNTIKAYRKHNLAWCSFS